MQRKLGVRRRRRWFGWRIALLTLTAVVGVAAFAGSASAYASFFVSASTNVWNYSNTLDVNTYASYSDYSCTPSYSCDRNVLVAVVLHRGIGTYSPIVGRQVGQTGQYGSSVRTSFRLPSCRYIPRFSSQTYTVEVNAAAPDGTERQATRMVTQRSCALS
jgi:hypothetical protein